MVYEWERRFQSHILSRGWNYAADGAVSGLNKNGDTVTAVVEGTEYYRVEICYIGTMVREAYCSCPYAADGNWCKHMAAVLYEIEDSEFDNVPISPRKEKKPEIKPSSVKELVASVDREKLESLLLELADSDPRVESYIRASIRDKKLSVDIKKIEKEIDGIFAAFSGRGGYIDYYNASDFECGLVTLLENRAQDLIDDEKYKEAFDLSVYNKEKKERYESYISYYDASIDEFRIYREMCTPEEWMVHRRNLIDSKKDIEKKCELLVEEKLLDELYETIWNQTEKLKLVNKYGFLLADNHSSEILDFYKNYVSKLAEVACNRSRYDELIGYLLRMRHYKNGNDLVITLCKDWSVIYQTRKVMVQELSKLIY